MDSGLKTVTVDAITAKCFVLIDDLTATHELYRGTRLDKMDFSAAINKLLFKRYNVKFSTFLFNNNNNNYDNLYGAVTRPYRYKGA